MDKVRIGVICPSEIAFRRFLPSLKKATTFEYVGVAIANKEEFVGATDEILTKERLKAQSFVDNYGGIVFDSYRQLIRHPEVDAIYLPLPPSLHFKWAMEALENGKHVLVEKPSTTCLSDTQQLISIADKKGLALHENYMFVFHKQIEEIKKIISRGEIGDVRLFRITFGFPRRLITDFRYNKSLGGGALLDAGGYTMKLASIMMEGDLKITSANVGYLSDFDVDIYGAATLANDKGEVAQIAFGMDNDYRCDLEVWGSIGTLTTGRILTAPAGFSPSYTIKKNQEILNGELPDDDAFLKSINRFADCINNETIRKNNYQLIYKQECLVDEFIKHSNYR